MSEKLYIPSSGEMAKIAGLEVPKESQEAEGLITVTSDSNHALIEILNSGRVIDIEDAMLKLKTASSQVELPELVDPGQIKREQLNTGEDYY